MKIKEYLEKVAYIEESNLLDDDGKIYYSNFDNSYITRVGMEKDIKFLADREITEHLMHGVGFSPKDGKWYGWSHRAIHGFSIGSTCKKGNCHYTADNPEEMIEDYANFFADISKECAESHRKECSILPDRSGIFINHSGVELPTAKNLEELKDNLENGKELETDLVLDGVEIQKCGKGEWVVETMEDAKQMAIDFNEGVS